MHSPSLSPLSFAAPQEAAKAVVRRQMKHVMFTEPEVITAGERVTVYYCPDDTVLAGTSEVFFTGGFNRWSHKRTLGPVAMRPPGPNGRHWQVRAPAGAAGAAAACRLPAAGCVCRPCMRCLACGAALSGLSLPPSLSSSCTHALSSHTLTPFSHIILFLSPLSAPSQVRFSVPKDALQLDFVFSNVPGGDGLYDNRGGFDYHLPVKGGTGSLPDRLHVVHIAVEMAPIAKVGGLGDVVTALGRAVQEEGHLVEVVLPR